MKAGFYKSLVFKISTHTPIPFVIFKGNEYWLPVENTGGLYYVSSFGKVLSFRKNKPGVLLKFAITRKNYLMCYMYPKNAPRINISIHRLVALHFLDNPLGKPEVNHKKGIKSDNRVSQLEWQTTKENINHAINTGLRTAAQNLLSGALFSADILIDIRKKIKAGLSNTIIAKEYNCHHSTISKIRTGVNYK